MSKIALVSIAVESYSIEILSSFLKKKGHQTAVFFDPSLFATEIVSSPKLANFFDIRHHLVKKILSQKPDFVGFSVFTINYQRTLSLARLIKKLSPSTPIIFGGIHPTSVPEIVIKQKCVDIVCVGEGELALNRLLNSPQSTKIKNLWFKKNGHLIKNPLRPLIKNLDSLPFPDKESFYRLYSGFLTDYYTCSSRGCPFGCTFCANNVLNKVQKGLGPILRRRSPQNLIDELSWAKKSFPIKQITFTDDIFVQDLNWLKTFTKLYRRYIKLPYVALTHPAFVDFQKAKLLKNSGCYFLLLGIQSASEKIRKKILKRYESNQQIIMAASACHQAKLHFSVDHILNIPGETIKDYVFALNFYHRLKPAIINCFYLQYFPQTEIIKKAKLSPKLINSINQGQSSSSVVVGFGHKNTIDSQLIHSNFQFFFLLIPVLPQFAVNFIIDQKLYLKKFHPSLFLNTLIKLLLSFRVKRFAVYQNIIKQNIFFLIKTINLKLKDRLSKTSSKSIWEKQWKQFTKKAAIRPNKQVINHIVRLFNNKLTHKKILEVGAGSGSDSIYLSKLGADVTILDFSPQSIKIAKSIAAKENTKIKTILSDCRHIPLKNHRFDLVFSVGLLEHFSNPLPVITEQVRLLKKNGYLLIDVPQKYNLYTIIKKIRMLTGSFPFGWETEYSLFDLKKISSPLKLKPVFFYGRDSGLIQKLPNNLRPPFQKILAIIESSPLAPLTCLNIGAIFKNISNA